ncbi:MAG: F0F1 ATP synthase subunit B, partial [Streptococcus thermophilus]
EKQLQASREEVVAELRNEMGQNSISLAERLLGTELSDSTRRSNTIDEFLSELDRVSTRK